MIFWDINKKLESRGYILQHEGRTGFTYAKKYGEYGGVQKVTYTALDDFFLSFDPEIPGVNGYGYSAVPIPASDIPLLLRKAKKWRKHYGHSN